MPKKISNEEKAIIAKHLMTLEFPKDRDVDSITPEELVKACERLVRQYNPNNATNNNDKEINKEMLRNIGQAYEFLADLITKQKNANQTASNNEAARGNINRSGPLPDRNDFPFCILHKKQFNTEENLTKFAAIDFAVKVQYYAFIIYQAQNQNDPSKKPRVFMVTYISEQMASLIRGNQTLCNDFIKIIYEEFGSMGINPAKYIFSITSNLLSIKQPIDLFQLFFSYGNIEQRMTLFDLALNHQKQEILQSFDADMLQKYLGEGLQAGNGLYLRNLINGERNDNLVNHILELYIKNLNSKLATNETIIDFLLLQARYNSLEEFQISIDKLDRLSILPKIKSKIASLPDIDNEKKGNLYKILADKASMTTSKTSINIPYQSTSQINWWDPVTKRRHLTSSTQTTDLTKGEIREIISTSSDNFANTANTGANTTSHPLKRLQ